MTREKVMTDLDALANRMARHPGGVR